MAELAKSNIRGRPRPADLPDYECPPVIEVVLGVQFAELTSFRTPHIGLLWQQKFRKEFPEFSEQGPLDTSFELFGDKRTQPSTQKPRIQVTVAQSPFIPRLWFVNKNKTELVQFQVNRFHHNWRGFVDNSDYPRYEPIRDRFFSEMLDLQDFIESEGLGTIEPNQCEVTYINHLSVDGKNEVRSDFDHIFAWWDKIEVRKGEKAGALPEFEDAQFGLRFVLTNPETSEAIGRLHVNARPAVDRDGAPMIRLTLTARGAPLTPSFQGVADFFDLGREAIVRGFTALTTPAMHVKWRRRK